MQLFGSRLLKNILDIPFELHMMVEEPINFLDSWADAGFQKFIGQLEKMSDQVEFVAKAQSLRGRFRS